MNSKIKDENTDFLFDAILQLQSKEECYQFFEDLCTVSELKALSQRIVVATGASTATISRVNRSLIYGCDGYDMVFSRLDKKKDSD